MKIFSFILFAILPTHILYAGELELNDIVKRAEMQQSKLVEEVQDAVFEAKSVYRETNKDGELKKEVIAERRIYMKGHDKRYEEYLRMAINGRELNSEEMEEELKDWRKKGPGDTKMPLTQEGRGAYEYNLLGSEDWSGSDVWIIGFEAKRKEDGYINGKLYISKDDFNIVRMEFTPVKIPRVIEDMNLSLTYSEIHGYSLPVKFEMDMKIKVGFLVDLFYRHITVEDTYSQYRFNNQLTDSFFESRNIH